MQSETIPAFYGYSSYEDEPFRGTYESVDTAAVAGFDYYPDAESIWICEGYPVAVRNFVHADSILDNIADAAFDDVGEVVDDWFTEVPNDKKQELKDLIADWVIKHYPPNFWLAKNAKQVFRKDYPDVDQLPEE